MSNPALLFEQEHSSYMCRKEKCKAYGYMWSHRKYRMSTNSCLCCNPKYAHKQKKRQKKTSQPQQDCVTLSALLFFRLGSFDCCCKTADFIPVIMVSQFSAVSGQRSHFTHLLCIARALRVVVGDRRVVADEVEHVAHRALHVVFEAPAQTHVEQWVEAAVEICQAQS